MTSILPEVPPEVVSKLHRDGFYHFRNVMSPENVDYARKYVTDTANYTKMEVYISQVLGSLYTESGLQLDCTKYRISNNNNSVDAAGFHRDLQAMNNDIVEPVPVYTVLSYLDDDSTMELIPGSHKKYRMSILEAIRSLNNSVEIQVRPGDILIFHASLIHRGVFYKRVSNRRLIQCFDCTPNADYSQKILHLPCMKTCSKTMRTMFSYIAGARPLIKTFDTINYFNVATGYGSTSNFMARLNYEGIEFLSTESNTPRLKPKFDEPDILNKYIILHTNIRDQKEADVSFIYHHSMIIFYVLILQYTAAALATLYLVSQVLKAI